MDTLQLGPFLIDPSGGIQRAAPDLRPLLRFAWRGHACEAAVGDRFIELRAWAGRIPSTAEPGADRAGAFESVSALAASMPSGWRARLAPDHRVRVQTERPLGMPVSAVSLVTAMVGFVLELDPYLDRLEAAGVAAVSGSEKI